MPYEVIWSEKSKDDLGRLDKKGENRIVAKVESIKQNPFAFVKRLTGVELFSLRAGDYRVIMDIQRDKLIIFIVTVGHRKDIYKRIP